MKSLRNSRLRPLRFLSENKRSEPYGEGAFRKWLHKDIITLDSLIAKTIHGKLQSDIQIWIIHALLKWYDDFDETP